MDNTRKFVERDQLTELVRVAFGPTHHLRTIARLRGGSKKGVYRLGFDDESTAVLYVWDTAENYWPEQPEGLRENQTDPFADASGLNLFEASSTCLHTLGIRTPQVYFLDRSRSLFPAEIALIEDVRGGTLESRMQQDPQGAEAILDRLGAALQTMHQHQDERIGKLALVDSGEARQDRSCEQIVLDRALRHLAEAALRVERVAQTQTRMEARLHALAGQVRPRHIYSLIHGELGPDHILVNAQGDPVLIDIEGCMFFDVEWEHVFLQLRFHKHYQWLQASKLDEQRLRFYALAMHLSLVAGPLRLLDGDFPERAFMQEIADYHLQRALSCLQ